jgi:hypothetical protein
VRIPFQDFEGQFRSRLGLPITRRTKYNGGLPGQTRLCASARLKQGAASRVSSLGRLRYGARVVNAEENRLVCPKVNAGWCVDPDETPSSLLHRDDFVTD